MQASRTWRAPTGTLGSLVAEARQRAQVLSARADSLGTIAREVVVERPLGGALRKCFRDVGVIAEVKRRSPSKGWIGRDLDAGSHASAYERGGAIAVSVLTEPAHFGGSNADLQDVLRAVRIPVLKKDFHVEPVQLLEAKALGASGALVIVRAVGPDGLQRLLEIAAEIQFDLLVEVHTEEELVIALESGARTIGVNNRDLETLEIDSATCDRVVPLVPRDHVVVAESGVASKADVERMALRGANAVLVGSVVSASGEPEQAVRDLVGFPTVTRGS